MTLVAIHEAPDIPTEPAELARCLKDAKWRLSHLYKILIKGDDEDGSEDTVLHFRPNRAQQRFMRRLWYRNLILKARQLGFTTLICILWLDHALFRENQRCGVIAHNEDAALTIFRDKVGFAYDNLPETVKRMIPTKVRNDHEIMFTNNSSIRVATSMRSGTLHRLLVSEYGKICAEFPKRATEVQTGSLQTVPLTGIAVIESTAEGMDGDFYKKTQKAMALEDKGAMLGPKDYRFHFYAWWQDPNYRVDPSTVLVTQAHEDYFREILMRVPGLTLDQEQRAWYVATLDGDFSGDEQVMWREYPSYPEEAFKVSTEGTYYAKQLQAARREGRIGVYPYMPGVPVNTFWDLGLNDVTAMWYHQRVHGMDRFINYIEESGEGPDFFAKHQQDTKYVMGTNYLPHDGATRIMTQNKPITYEQLLRKALGGAPRIVIVKRILNVTTGIDMMRMAFPGCCFDEKNCAVGLVHVQNYRKEWNTAQGCWSDHPKHDVTSNAADALRQFGQGYIGKIGTRGQRKAGDWKTA